MSVVLRTICTTALLRYSRSWGLWALLLVGLIGTRFMVPRDDGTAVTIAINQQIPVMTPAFLGVALGEVAELLGRSRRWGWLSEPAWVHGLVCE